MSKKYTIHVTQADIDDGCQGNADNCPIARAIIRAYGMHAKVASQTTLHTAVDEKEFGRVDTPTMGRVFIDRYDNVGKHAVSPFSFEMELPDKPVQIWLTGPEAATLSSLTAKVAGSSTRSPRGHVDSIGRKLSAAGVPSYSKTTEYGLHTYGSALMFNNYPDTGDHLPVTVEW